MEKVADQLRIPVAALRNGVNFGIPPAPNLVVSNGVSDVRSRYLLELPENPGVVTVLDQATGPHHPATLPEVVAEIEKAMSEGTPVWIVIGQPH